MGSRIASLVKVNEVPAEQSLSNELWERFCWLYVFGSEGLGLEADPPVLPHNGNAAYRYLRPEISDGGVRSQTWKLLRRPEVIERIVDLKEERDRQIKARTRGFVPHLDAAIDTLDEIRRGVWRPERSDDVDPRTIPQLARVAYLASTEIVSRVLGSVRQQHESQLLENPIVVQVVGPSGMNRDAPRTGTTQLLEAGIVAD